MKKQWLSNLKKVISISIVVFLYGCASLSELKAPSDQYATGFGQKIKINNGEIPCAYY